MYYGHISHVAVAAFFASIDGEDRIIYLGRNFWSDYDPVLGTWTRRPRFKRRDTATVGQRVLIRDIAKNERGWYATEWAIIVR